MKTVLSAYVKNLSVVLRFFDKKEISHSVRHSDEWKG